MIRERSFTNSYKPTGAERQQLATETEITHKIDPTAKAIVHPQLQLCHNLFILVSLKSHMMSYFPGKTKVDILK